MLYDITPYLSLGPLRLHWYGIMYIVAFATFTLLALYRLQKHEGPYTPNNIFDFLVWAAVGLLAGGRLGYALFYAPSFFLANPFALIWPFQDGSFVGISGMSYHGGLIGVIIATVLFTKKFKLNLSSFADFAIPCIPFAYTWGRLGNFLNGELWGRPTEAAVGVIFANDVTGLPRHPSQLYEAALEGLVVGIILWTLRNNKKLQGRFLGLYLVLYALARFVVEFFREPDAHLGAVLGPLSMGQVLSLGMIIVGGYLLSRQPEKTTS